MGAVQALSQLNKKKNRLGIARKSLTLYKCFWRSESKRFEAASGGLSAMKRGMRLGTRSMGPGPQLIKSRAFSGPIITVTETWKIAGSKKNLA